MDPVQRNSLTSPPVEFQKEANRPVRGIEAVMRAAADAAEKKYKKRAQLLVVVLPEPVSDKRRNQVYSCKKQKEESGVGGRSFY